MQGTVRGQPKIPDSAKRALWTELNRPASEPEPEKREPSEALKSILGQAEELFSENRDVPPPKSDTQHQPTRGANRQNRVFNPFSSMYPDSRWQRRRFRNVVMFEGTVELAGERLFVQAIPGGFSDNNPAFEKMGFTKFIRDDSGRGYRMRIKYIPKQNDF